ncbi:MULTISPECIES: nitrogenase cofactor biosynthesis protein NifB [unclassified Parafrankia]|uniref:nitrogenase cofactor biosynthesis protein NifB n=1 Tax=unclassified Parafrankia TaxID=2994368 RepID=UPI000DA4D832|nr:MULTISPECIES: nitrogenase cofactor biosynthesis protein NifB [unclassified Parafrankia]TCJ32875.1 nitrogenase cofactor biosynthesis protein NifB [Parafrankia sp. BMG5.11]CAI7980019.1 nitrogen fixation protein NifB [Frankia sp. Hr75.2]SQD98509.1 Nitrogenase cofactor biosynthesis protein NifB [Parafrankia sp. Ea1.12]
MNNEPVMLPVLPAATAELLTGRTATPGQNGSPAQGAAPAPGGGCASKKSCGSSTPATDPEIAEKIANHPCYSSEAHQYYARMHVAVAPGCNIQCNYCNRKYDCANESRPGVTSDLLTPEDALAKVKLVASEIKQMSVLGIAGPGDPLANPKRTFRTLELVARDCPDIKLCLSTNGLTLPDHVDRIAALNVDHVTITINMIDPEVGERIYPWVAYKGKKYTGREASKILSERQLEGLAMLAERKILAKVNSVMIPGVNDEHLVEVSKTVRGLGAFLHNVMPLVSAPEHGTVFGLAGQPGPTPQQLKALQDRCEGEDGADMNMMRHCRQCRADAVGLLGEDRGDEFTPETYQGREIAYDLEGRLAAHAEIERWRQETRAERETVTVAGPATRPDDVVLVAVATKGSGVVNQHFGHASEFWIYEAGRSWARLVQTRDVQRYCEGPTECGDGASVLDKTIEMLSDCSAVLCSKIGPGPYDALEAAGIEPVEVYELIEKAVATVGGRLTAAARAAVPVNPDPAGTGFTDLDEIDLDEVEAEMAEAELVRAELVQGELVDVDLLDPDLMDDDPFEFAVTVRPGSCSGEGGKSGSCSGGGHRHAAGSGHRHDAEHARTDPRTEKSRAERTTPEKARADGARPAHTRSVGTGSHSAGTDVTDLEVARS